MRLMSRTRSDQCAGGEFRCRSIPRTLPVCVASWPHLLPKPDVTRGAACVCVQSPMEAEWINLCTATVSCDSRRMDGIWIQQIAGEVAVAANRSGRFSAHKVCDDPNAMSINVNLM